MPPCILRATRIIGTCGGKGQSSHMAGIHSKIIPLEEIKIFPRRRFFQNSPDYNVVKFMHEWKELATQVHGLLEKQLIQSHVGGLKSRI